MMHDYFYMGGGGFIMMFIPLLLVGIVIYAVYQLSLRNKVEFKSSKRPEDLLDERFVKGEITEEEYKQMKELLKK